MDSETRAYVDKLVRLGISRREASVYLALLQWKQLAVVHLQELVDIPRTKIYEVTKSLTHRGMCIEKLVGKKKMYQAVAPTSSFKKLIVDYEDELQGKKDLALELEQAFDRKYNQENVITNVFDYIEIIQGHSSVHARYVDLVRNTKKEILAFIKSPFAHEYSEKRLDEQVDAADRILKKGVVVRTIYETPCEEESKTLIKLMEMFARKGEEIRIAKQVPLKMTIFDGKHVLMMLQNPKLMVSSSLTEIVIENPGLALAGIILFNHLWETGKDYHVFLGEMAKEKRKH